MNLSGLLRGARGTVSRRMLLTETGLSPHQLSRMIQSGELPPHDRNGLWQATVLKAHVNARKHELLNMASTKRKEEMNNGTAQSEKSTAQGPARQAVGAVPNRGKASANRRTKRSG